MAAAMAGLMLPGASPAHGAAMLDGAVRPTKLFIGGISRRTTTKQLRDHFSKYGRVLDCVAMRRPDGRPRGFGYVTLDTPAAAGHILLEPQMIDDRIVDVKPAVPDASTDDGLTSEVNGNVAPTATGWTCFPYGAGHGGHSIDLDFGCMHAFESLAVDALMRGHYESLMSPMGALTGVPNTLYNGYSLLSSAAMQVAATTLLSTSPSQDSSPPQENAVPKEVSETSSGSLRLFFDKPRKIKVLGELDVDDGPEDYANLGGDGVDFAPMKPPSPTCSTEPPSSDDLDDDGTPNNRAAFDLTEGLPSLGSASHSSGDCKRCNFFAKGRCRNGMDCCFCHFPHDRRKLSRQEKREVQAARAQQDEGDDPADDTLLEPVLLATPPGLSLSTGPPGLSAPTDRLLATSPSQPPAWLASLPTPARARAAASSLRR